MKAFNELDEKDQSAIILIAASSLLRKFLSYRQDDIDDIPDGIFNDLTILSNNKHPKQDNKELTEEVRTRIKTRVAKAIYKAAYEQVKISNYSDNAPSDAYKFDLKNWLTTLAGVNPSAFLPPKSEKE